MTIFCRAQSSIAVELQAKADGTLLIELGCKNALLSQEQSQLLIEQYEAILVDMITNPRNIATDVGYPTRLLSTCNSDAKPYEVSDINFLHNWVEYYAVHSPEKVALEFASDITQSGATTVRLTYRELNEQANRIAHALCGRGLNVEELIPVCIPRSTLMYATILAVLKAGAAYVPVDPDAPADRKKFIIQDTAARIVLTVNSQIPDLREGLSGVELVALDTLEADIQKEPDTNPVIAGHGPKNVAYVLFTSGTTGRPKGVLVEHGNVVQAMAAFQHLIPFTPDSRFLQFASCAFDVSIFETFLSWSKGICLCGAPKDVLLRDIELALRTLRISHADLTPSVAALVKRDNVPSLRVLVTGGEALTQQVLDEWAADECIYNAYGPTEATIGCTMLPRVKKTDKTCNIGKPFGNVAAYVMSLDEPLRPVLRGSVGELCVGGPLVARGYLNQETLTAQKFVDWTDTVTGISQRLYKTGDLVRLMPDDTLEFLGRADQQVKLNGIRIEVDEISNVLLRAHPDVKAAVTMLVKQSQQAKKQLASFLVLDGQYETDECMILAKNAKAQTILDHVTAEAERKLPLYMVPRHILLINKLPLGPTGKADTKTLARLYEQCSPAMLRSDSGYGKESQGELTEEEKLIRDAVANVAKMKDTQGITRYTTIFELGIDSLSAISLSSRLKRIGFDLSVLDVLQHPTIGGLAALRNNSNGGSAGSAVERMERGRSIVSEFRAKHKEAILSQLGKTSEDVTSIYPCTPLQEGMIAQCVQSSGTLYVNRFMFELEKGTDFERLREAWEQVMTSNDILRTGFCPVDEGYAQVVYAEVDASIWTVERFDDETQLEKRVRQYNERMGHLDLRTPPIHLSLFEYASCSSLEVILHHALYDGSCLPFIFEEVQRSYHGLDIVARSPFSKCVEYIVAADEEDDQRFWKQNLNSCVPTIFPNLVNMKPENTSEVSAQHQVSLSLSEIENACKRLGTTLSALGQLAWAKILATYVSAQNVVFGHVVSGRTIPVTGIESILGPCFNTIPCRIQLDSGRTNVELLKRIQQQNADILPHQHSSLRTIQNWIGRRDNRPLFDTLFLFQRNLVSTNNTSVPQLWREVDSNAPIDVSDRSL